MNARPNNRHADLGLRESRSLSFAHSLNTPTHNDRTSLCRACLEGAALVSRPIGHHHLCMPVDMRLMEVRIPWEPSSFLEDNDRKNLYVELRDPMVRAYLQRQEESLGAEGWGQVSSCLAKEGLIRCKISMKSVHVFDKDRRTITTPAQFAGLVCNVLVKLIGKWQTPDGSATGLNLQATDLQVLRVSERECPF